MRPAVVILASAGLAVSLSGARLFAQQRPAPNSSAPGAGLASCDASDARLRACYTFDGDTKDRSSYGNHANAANVTYAPGQFGKALRLASNSRVLVAQHPSLDLTAMTIKLWIRPTSFPVRRREALAGWQGAFAREIFAWVEPPVLNKYTRLGVEMCPARGILRADGYEL